MFWQRRKCFFRYLTKLDIADHCYHGWIIRQRIHSRRQPKPSVWRTNLWLAEYSKLNIAVWYQYLINLSTKSDERSLPRASRTSWPLLSLFCQVDSHKNILRMYLASFFNQPKILDKIFESKQLKWPWNVKCL